MKRLRVFNSHPDACAQRRRSHRRACVQPLFLIYLFTYFYIHFQVEDFCQTNYLNIYRTDRRQIVDPLRDVAVATNFCCFYPQNL